MKTTQKTYMPYIYVGFFSLFALAFLDNSRGPFFQDIISDLHLTDSVASLFFVATSLLSFCMGRSSPMILAGRLSLLNLVRIGHLVMALGFAMISQVQSLSALIAAAALFGVGYGIINITQNILIVEGAKPQLRRRLLSGLHSIYALASLVAPLAISFLIEDGIGWRQAFLAFSALPLLAFGLTFCARQQVIQRIESGQVKVISTFNLKNFLIAVGAAFYVMAELVLSTRMPLYFRRLEQTPADVASLYLALFFLLLFIGRLGFAFLHLDKYSNLQVMLGSLFLSFLTVLIGLFVSPFGLVLAGLPMAPFFGVSLTYITDSFGKGAHAALGSALALQALFIVTMHYILGWITEVWGIRSAMLSTPIFLLLSVMFIIFGSRKAHASIA